MDQNQKKPTQTKNNALDVANDQLGENASMEFAAEYDNKTNQKNKNLEKNTK